MHYVDPCGIKLSLACIFQEVQLHVHSRQNNSIPRRPHEVRKAGFLEVAPEGEEEGDNLSCSGDEDWQLVRERVGDVNFQEFVNVDNNVIPSQILKIEEIIDNEFNNESTPCGEDVENDPEPKPIPSRHGALDAISLIRRFVASGAVGTSDVIYQQLNQIENSILTHAFISELRFIEFAMAVAVLKNPPVVSKALFVPPLEEVVTVLSHGLTSNFSNVKVGIVDCPDLTREPFTLACKGLGGKPRLIEIGGPPYLLPLVQKNKLYDMADLGKFADVEPAFLIGAGAGPWPYAGGNCEMIVNLELKGGKVNNHSRIAKVNTKDGSCILERLPDTETRCAVLANIFCSEGKPGKVLQVSCKKRIGKDDFIASIRKTLQAHYKDKAVGLGGTFLLKAGKARQHVMPEFSTTPINTDEEVEKWLRFYNMSAPLIAAGTLVSADPGLDLRLQHFHSFSHHGEGGHYHIDTEPDTVEYLGYFTLGECVYRVDQPTETHQVGRD